MGLKRSDYRYFEEARRVAATSDFPRFHVGCVVVYKGHVIGSAANTSKSAPVQKRYNKYRKFNYASKGVVRHSLHAEIAALKSIQYTVRESVDWKRVKVYTYRICPGNTYGIGLSRCCPACMTYIRELGIRDIYYTTEDGYAHEELS